MPAGGRDRGDHFRGAATASLGLHALLALLADGDDTHRTWRPVDDPVVIVGHGRLSAVSRTSDRGAAAVVPPEEIGELLCPGAGSIHPSTSRRAPKGTSDGAISPAQVPSIMERVALLIDR